MNATVHETAKDAKESTETDNAIAGDSGSDCKSDDPAKAVNASAMAKAMVKAMAKMAKMMVKGRTKVRATAKAMSTKVT